MRTFKHLFVAALAITFSAFSDAQDAKQHLRDFSPRCKIDTFKVQGETKSFKRSVINALTIKGIKSVFWDEDSNVFTVQYEERLINLSSIKSLFMPEMLMPSKHKSKEGVYAELL